MASPSTQFASTRRMGIYDPLHQISMWEDVFAGDIISPTTPMPTILQVEERPVVNKPEYISQEPVDHSSDNQAAKNVSDKSQRRLAQNREAARKSRLRKKAYVQQLETSRLKLAQLEQELDRTRQGAYNGVALNAGNAGFSAPINPAGIVAFDIEYGLWVEDQDKRNCELRNVLQANISDNELRLYVENGLNHFDDLFRMKADAAKVDVFYLMSGMWRTPVERFFLWIGGFRPSEILKILMPQLEPLTEQQRVSVSNLRHSCQQAEDALSQGLDKLQQSLTLCVTGDIITGGLTFSSQMASAIERLESLEIFMNQADHLRHQTLQQMYRILTIRQAAQGLLAFGEYFQRLRALSLLWATHSQTNLAQIAG